MKHRRNLWIGLAFLLPNLIGFLLFTAGPMAFSVGASFTNWDLTGIEPFRFNGVENFVNLSADAKFWSYLVNTVYFLIGLPISIFGSLAVAILLTQKIRGQVVYRTLLYLPSVTSGVAVMILWKALYNPDFGPVNQVIEAVGRFFGGTVEGPNWLLTTQNLLGISPEKVAIDPKQWGVGAREALIFMGVWGAIGGGNTLLYIAALGNVPLELTEASELDGASRWRTFKAVVWPQLAPTTFFITVMGFIGGLQGGFEQARIMTEGGPAGSTTTLAYYIYNKAFVEYQMGYACAVSLVLFLLIFGVTLVNWRFGNREVAY